MLPSHAKLVVGSLKLTNGVMYRAPANGHSRRLAVQWSTIARIKKTVNKLRINSKTRPQNLSLLTLNILTAYKAALSTFRNVDLALVLGCAKVNIAFTN